MINITIENNLVEAAVLGKFTLTDFRDFEEKLLGDLRFQGGVNVLIDLRDMLSFTVDVAWEEIRFSRKHAREFGKIAIVTSSQWQTWSVWFTSLFAGVDVDIFDNINSAEAWLNGADT